MRRIAAFGDLVTHPRPQLECSAITKFSIEFSLDHIQHVPEIAPVIRQIAGAIFNQAHAQITDGEGAPGGFSRFAGMDGWGNSGPVGYRKWQCGDFHVVTPVLIEPDHRVRHVRFLETSDFVFGQPNINRGQRIVEVLEFGGPDDRRGYHRLGQ